MNQIHGNSIALDLIGISSEYKGGASIFAKTLLSEFIKMSDQELIVILPESERANYSDYQSCPTENITFHFFSPRGGLVAKVLFRVATRMAKNASLLGRVQRLRWRDAIEVIENSSSSCLSLSTYISFPLKGINHYCTLHDIQEKSLPQFFSAKERSIRNIQVLNTLKNVTGLQVSSLFVQNEIRKYYPRESKKVVFKVIPEGYSAEEIGSPISFLEKKSSSVRVIFPANYWPHKDHLTFLRALASIKNDLDLEVFCTGSTFDKDSEINNLLADLKLTNVKFTGYLTRPELIKLYKSSHIVISCSMYESSSLPLLEGAVLGCIPIASNIAPHVEMSERLVMHLFELSNVEDLKRVLLEVVGSITFGEANENPNSVLAKEFSWQVLMSKYIDALQGEKYGRNRL